MQNLKQIHHIDFHGVARLINNDPFVNPAEQSKSRMNKGGRGVGGGIQI